MKKIMLIVLCCVVQLKVYASDIEKAQNNLLDGFHQAASEANYDAYFGALTPQAIFLGTDATERWTKDMFSDYVKPYFDKGIGWTYTPTKRLITQVNAEVAFLMNCCITIIMAKPEVRVF